MTKHRPVSKVESLRSALLESLCSSGGRPALNGATRRQKVPMSEADWQALERIASELGDEVPGLAAGQVAGQLLHDSIAELAASGRYRIADQRGHTLSLADRRAGSTPPRRSGAERRSSALTRLVDELRIERTPNGALKIEVPPRAAHALLERLERLIEKPALADETRRPAFHAHADTSLSSGIDPTLIAARRQMSTTERWLENDRQARIVAEFWRAGEAERHAAHPRADRR